MGGEDGKGEGMSRIEVIVEERMEGCFDVLVGRKGRLWAFIAMAIHAAQGWTAQEETKRPEQAHISPGRSYAHHGYCSLIGKPDQAKPSVSSPSSFRTC